jgi:PAS domain-containing protein
MNKGLAYTIHRFSNHFQSMQETCLKDYARRLEKDVAKRTAELKASEQQYRSLVDEISDGYQVLHNDTISLVNPVFCQMHQINPEDALEKPFLDFVVEESRRHVHQMILKEKGENALPLSSTARFS